LKSLFFGRLFLLAVSLWNLGHWCKILISFVLTNTKPHDNKKDFHQANRPDGSRNFSGSGEAAAERI